MSNALVPPILVLGFIGTVFLLAALCGIVLDVCGRYTRSGFRSPETLGSWGGSDWNRRSGGARLK
jgi:hypothetical protein